MRELAEEIIVQLEQGFDVDIPDNLNEERLRELRTSLIAEWFQILVDINELQVVKDFDLAEHLEQVVERLVKYISKLEGVLC